VEYAGHNLRLGDPLGHRYRVLSRRHGIARPPSAGLPQALSDGARDHRRPRAIVIIAIFYTEELSWVSLEVALAALAVLVILNLAGVRRVIWYVLVGLVL